MSGRAKGQKQSQKHGGPRGGQPTEAFRVCEGSVCQADKSRFLVPRNDVIGTLPGLCAVSP
jgi:hypothetical protein